MKLQTLRRGGVAAAAVIALSGGLAACGSSNNTADNTTGGTSSAPTDSTSSGSTSDAGAQTFGPACSAVPATGAGSFNGMVQDPVATAASNNKILSTLVTTVQAAGLVDTLNSSSAQYTVFAPYNDAFAALPKATVTSLLAGAKKDGPKSALATILTHHVLPEQLGPDSIDGTQTTVAGDDLTISGDPQSGMTVSDGTVTAKVLCGNIPTANATVYIIDKVLTGVKSK